jgi:hypothetical protein
MQGVVDAGTGVSASSSGIRKFVESIRYWWKITRCKATESYHFSAYRPRENPKIATLAAETWEMENFAATNGGLMIEK